MRLQRSLAGRWRFQVDPEASLHPTTLTFDRDIPVPLPWQAAFPDLRTYSGFAWYATTFDLDDTWLTGELLLDFGAVDYWCQVFINGTLVGEHEGGYTPFRFAIGRHVRRGENSLIVRVFDPVQDSIVFPRWRRTGEQENDLPFNAADIPHGKQDWYLNVGGIWQDVTLSAVPPRYIEHVHLLPDIHTGDVHINVTVAGAPTDVTVRASIDGSTAETMITGAETTAVLSLCVDQPALWTPDSPTLYTLDVVLDTSSGQDTASRRFGFREISTRDGQLLLNGEPLYLLCALDQDMYPDTIYTVPSDAFLRDQFHKAKHLGLNCLRCHIKPPDPRYLDLADEIGLLVWAEIPSWRTFHIKTTVHPSALHLSDDIKARVQATLEAMVDRDYHHPSLVIWTIVNEDWGTSLLLSDDDRAWVAEMTAYCRQLDPGRLVVNNSPCPAAWGLSVHIDSDLDDFHIYTNIPDQAEQFEQFVEQFGLRPLWSYSNSGDARRTGAEPIILSEFGNWALPSLRPYSGEEPDWFDLGAWWSPWDGEPGWPAGVLSRFKTLGLDRIWPDYEAFAEATQWHACAALKFELETLRRQPAIRGYVITELSDIYWESNGLLDFARCPKVFHDRFARFNAPDVLIPHLSRYAWWDDEAVRVRLHASHYSSEDWSQVRARGQHAGQTVFEQVLPPLERGGVRPLEPAIWRLPKVTRAETLSLELSLEGMSRLNETDVTVLVLPSSQRQAAYRQPVAVLTLPEKSAHTIDSLAPAASGAEAAVSAPVESDSGLTPLIDPAIGSVRRALNGLGYRTTGELSDDTRLLITDHPSADILAWVRAGGDMLLINGSSGSPFFWKHGRGGAYGGNWITSFSWLRPGLYRRLQVANPLTLPFMDLMPLQVILGLPVTDPAFHGDFLAGQVSGWLRLPALHTVQFRYGQGRVIMTTYRLREGLSYHPLAAAMLHDLVDHLTSDACQPTLTANYR